MYVKNLSENWIFGNLLVSVSNKKWKLICKKASILSYFYTLKFSPDLEVPRPLSSVLGYEIIVLVVPPDT